MFWQKTRQPQRVGESLYTTHEMDVNETGAASDAFFSIYFERQQLLALHIIKECELSFLEILLNMISEDARICHF